MWHWKPGAAHDAAGADDATGLNESFSSQAEAEQWLTGSYEDLLEAGVTEVSLFEGDRLVYGPMSLEAV